MSETTTQEKVTSDQPQTMPKRLNGTCGCAVYNLVEVELDEDEHEHARTKTQSSQPSFLA